MNSENFFRSEYISYGVFPHKIDAMLLEVGDDILIVVGGGEKPHIGAVALSYLDMEEGQKSCRSSVITVSHHKENEIALHAAEQLAYQLNKCATVSVGLHIDNATRLDIDLLVSNFFNLIDEIKMKLLSRQVN